jgi:hypothetical protein
MKDRPKSIQLWVRGSGIGEEKKSCECKSWYFILHVDCLKMLHKQNVLDTDIHRIKNILNHFLSRAFMSLDDFMISRFDACVNFSMRAAKERECFFSLLHFLPDKLRYVKRDKYYATSDCHGNKSRTFLIYDKRAERTTKNQRGKLYERNTIRFELQVKNRRVKYDLSKGISRSADIWMNPTREKQLLLEFNKILPPADFWSLNKAIEIVHYSSFKPSMQEKLIDYLRCVAASGKMNVDTSRCEKTLSAYRRHLVSLNVNPITIAEKWGLEYLQNPMAHY